MGILDRILRAGEGKKLKALEGMVPEINAFEPEISALSDDALKAKTVEFRQRLDNGADVDDLLLEAFAVCREAAKRTIGQRHYDVQLMGGAALHFGWVAEMKTGEGKTLVSTLPAYLNGLTGKGVHLVTVNDYLARRDAEWMGQIHRWLGLDVGLIIPGYRNSPDEKRRSYSADITYATNNEMGFDYLRDNMAQRKADKVQQRGHNYCIVDEVDSILIDEARTPLIISGRVGDAAKLYYRFASIARSLQRDVDYEVEEDKRVVVPLEEGIEKVERALEVENLYDNVQAEPRPPVHGLAQGQGAVQARQGLHRAGRRGEDRRRVHRSNPRGASLVGGHPPGRRGQGRGEDQRGEPDARDDHPAELLPHVRQARRHDRHRPDRGGRADEHLRPRRGADPDQPADGPLDAAPTSSTSPKRRSSTRSSTTSSRATRRASRSWSAQRALLAASSSGVCSASEASPTRSSTPSSTPVRPRSSPRPVASARSPWPPTWRAVASTSCSAATPKGWPAMTCSRRATPPTCSSTSTSSPCRSTRCPTTSARPRTKALTRYQELLAEYSAQCKAEGEVVRELGGLYVIGSERHDSRRIDNQLRGRAGRQGDPGASRFFLSLDDELMRLFATGALSYVMGRALPDDEAIEAKMVTKAIERAQTTVETKNAEIRKNVLKYDEVMNEQRKVIYKRRDQILDGEDLRSAAMEYLADAVDSLISTHCASASDDEWDLDGLAKELTTYWPNSITEEQLRNCGDTDEIYDMVMADATAHYERREAGARRRTCCARSNVR